MMSIAQITGCACVMAFVNRVVVRILDLRRTKRPKE